MKRISLSGYVSVQLGVFLKDFVKCLSPAAAQTVRETVFLICGAGSIMISRMARRMSWGPRRMIHREKRLCRQARSSSFDHVGIADGLRQKALQFVRRDSLIPLDSSDLVKPYGRKMEHLGIVRDGSKKTTAPGYWLVGAFVRLKRGAIFPMVMRCFSTVQPGIKSFNAILVQVIDQIRETLPKGYGILVCDRGFDAIRLLEPMLKRSLRFIVRLVGNRDLLFEQAGRWVKHNVRKWVSAQLAGGLRTLTATVRLPGRQEILHLIVAPPRSGRHKEPLMLLTRDVLTLRYDPKWIIEAYRGRWTAEDGLRAFKQSFGIEQVRVMTLRAIQRLVLLAAVAMAFVIHLTDKTKAAYAKLVDAAAQHFDQPIVYAFCRFAEGLRNLLTAEQLRANINQLGYG